MTQSSRRQFSRSAVPAITLGLLLASWASAACQRQVQPMPSASERLDSILLTSTSGIQQRERVVISDSLSWIKMWTRLSAAHVIPLPTPEVGFHSSIVVVVSAGETGAGHSIRIDSARVSGTSLKIYVRETMVEQCNMGDMMMRYPAHAVRVRRTVESVRFVEDSTVIRCPRP